MKVSILKPSYTCPPLAEPIAEMLLSQVDLLAIPCDKEEMCDNSSVIFMPQLVNQHAIYSE